MPKQKGLNLKQIYEKLNEMSAEISVLNEAVQDIKQNTDVPYEILPDTNAIFWDGYWSPQQRPVNGIRKKS